MTMRRRARADAAELPGRGLAGQRLAVPDASSRERAPGRPANGGLPWPARYG